MLPGIRSVLIAVVVAVGLLIGAFGMVAAFRVAQESRSGSLQADLAQRSRSLVLANEPRAVVPVEKPAPLEPTPLPLVEIKEVPELPLRVVVAAPQTEPPASEPPSVERDPEPPTAVATAPEAEPPLLEVPAAEASRRESPSVEASRAEPPAAEQPSAEPPIGGPLPDEAAVTRSTQRPHRGANRVAAHKKARQEVATKAKQEAAGKARQEALAKARAAR